MCFFSTDVIPSNAASVAVKCYAISVLLFQWVTAFLLILTGVRTYFVMNVVILCVGIVLFVIFWFKFKTMLKLITKMEIKMLIEKSYTHPLDN